MNVLTKAKEGISGLYQKTLKLIGAVGGSIEGVAKPEGEEAAAIRRRAGYCIAFALGSFFFAGTKGPFGTFPFASALLCSAGHAATLFVYAGAMAGAISAGSGSAPQMIILTMVLISRILLSPRSDIEGRKRFEEGLKIRILISLIAAFLLGIYSVTYHIDDSIIDGVLGFAFVAAALPLLTLLFTAAQGGGQAGVFREAGLCVLLFVAIYCLGKHTFFGYSFARSASFLVILTVGFYLGIWRGTVVGLICAAACGVNPLIFALSGFAGGAFRSFGAAAGAGASLAAGIGSAFYLNGFRYSAVFLGDALFAALIFIPLSRTGFFTRLAPYGGQSAESAAGNALGEEKKREEEKRKLSRLSKAFDELSAVCVKLACRLRDPALFELRDLTADVFDRYCRRCALGSYCWQKNYEDMNDGMNKLTTKLREKGPLEVSDLPEFLASRCRNIEKILWDINRAHADLVENALEKDKTELFALDYEAISDLLRESASAEDDFLIDPELQKKTSALIRSLGIRALACGAWGVRAKTLLASGVEIGSVAVTSAEIRRALEQGTGLALTEPEFSFSGDLVSMTLKTRRRFSVSSARAFICASGESVSGDNLSCFESASDYHYGCVCDGMGSGEEAASVSEISSIFLEKMLSAGNCPGVTLKLLSNFIRARSSEYHCTADILQIDLLSAKASFIKCGAPPSYILRDGKIFKIDARSMPLGLTKEINAEKVEIDLLEGDVVVLVSDGVAPTLEDALWLPELLVSCRALPLPDLADAVVKRAKAENGNGDDISALALKISPCA